MADSLLFSVGADTKGFNDGIGGMLGALAGLVAAFVSAQAVVEAFGQAIDLGGRMHDLSTRTGETAGNLAILERAFENTSVGAEKLGPAIAKMQDNIVAASDESSKAASAFERLGLSFDDLDGKSPTEQLELIGVRLSGIADPADRAAIAIDIFGKSGSELLPVLLNFNSEIEEAERQLGSLPSLLDQSAGSVDSLGDNLSAISNKATEMAYGFLNEVIPAVEGFAESLSGTDAASIGAGLADALIGAFVKPMEAAELLGEMLELGAKNMGNVMYDASYNFGSNMFNTFAALGDAAVPTLIAAIGGGLDAAVQQFVSLMLDGIANAMTAFSNIPGLDHLSEVAEELRNEADKWSAGATASFEAARTEADKILAAFFEVQGKSQQVQMDFFNAEGSTEEIKAKFAAIQASAKDVQNSFNSIFSPTGGSIAEFGGGPVFGDGGVDLNGQESVVGGDISAMGEWYTESMAAIDKAAVHVATSFDSAGKSAAQLAAEFQKQLNTLAGMNPDQAIGKSASAAEILEKQEELEQLESAGKGGSAEAEALKESIETHEDIINDIPLTAQEQQDAYSEALEEFRDPDNKGKTLEDLIEENMEEAKDAKRDQETQDQEDQAKNQTDPDKQKSTSIQSIAQQLLALMQKVEPKIPQHIMS